jgi:hypothetical protein
VYIDDEHPYSAYDFTMSRSRDGPAAFLRDYRGFLQADAYGGYDEIFLGSDGRRHPEVGQVAGHPARCRPARAAG